MVDIIGEMTEKVVVAYGFENMFLIRRFQLFDGVKICKCIEGYETPFYTCNDVIICETEYDVIASRIREIEEMKPECMRKLEKLAWERGKNAGWRIVLSCDDICFDDGVEYESDGDENGDSR